MTIEAKRNDIKRIKNPGFVMLHINDMMDLKKAFFFRPNVVCEAAMLASEIVTLKDGAAKLGVSLVPSLTSRLVAELLGKCNKVEIISKPVRILFWVKSVMVSASSSLTSNPRIRFFSKSLVPCRNNAQLYFSAIWMMPALVLWNTQAAAFGLGFVDRECPECFVTATAARNDNTFDLSLGNSHGFLLSRGSMLPQTGKLENSENCWKPLRAAAATAWSVKTGANAENAADWAISSRTDEESPEGSTTRPWSPERTVKAHEYATRKGRYSLVCRESGRSAGLNACAITQRPYSNKLESLSKFEVKKPVMTALKNDAKKVFDRAAYAQFYQTPLRVVPTGGTATDAVTLTTNGTATLTNNIAYGNNHAKAVVDTMKERNIDPYVGDDYMAIAWPTTLRTFKNNLESLHQYTESGIKLIFNGEIGRYENVRYTEQTNVSKGITSTGSSGTAWTNSKSDWIFFFGEDTVAEGIAVPEEMRAKIPTDYGRSKGVAYYYLGGFGIVHTNAEQARILIWDSAA